jgi:hypothetical protein
LVKDFLAKYDLSTLKHPHTLLTWLQLIFTYQDVSNIFTDAGKNVFAKEYYFEGNVA